MGDRPQTEFGKWIDEQLAARGWKVRELARRLAARHPGGVTVTNVESARRQLNKYRLEGVTASEPMKRAIATAFETPAAGIPVEPNEDPLVVRLRSMADEAEKIADALAARGEAA